MMHHLPRRTRDLTSVPPIGHLYFHFAYIWFATIMLTCMLDSLVRVSRRDDNCHLINILAHDLGGPTQPTPDCSPQHCSCPQS